LPSCVCLKMEVVIQRAKSGSVTVDGSIVAEISRGLVCLVGVCSSDTPEDVQWVSTRLLGAKVHCYGNAIVKRAFSLLHEFQLLVMGE